MINYATLGFCWGAYERERGKPNYDYTGRVTELAEKTQVAAARSQFSFLPRKSDDTLTDDLI